MFDVVTRRSLTDAERMQRHQKSATLAENGQPKRRRIIDGSMVVAALRRPRGYVELQVMGALAGIMAVAIVACGLAGHVLSERDRATEAAAAAEGRADRCAVSLDGLVTQTRELRAQVDLHLAIDEDACACWQPVAP